MDNSNSCNVLEMGFLILLLLKLSVLVAGELGHKEYCSTETFTAKCFGSDVILMQHAVYGRMRIGRCVKSSYGSLGCSNNVLEVADRDCSGKSLCEIRIPDNDMNKGLDCSIELSRYLEASYTCVKALKPMDSCQNPVNIAVTSHVSHIPSPISENSACGQKDAPWILEAATGQAINLTLFDFNWTQEQPTRPGANVEEECYIQYGYITDSENSDARHRICGGSHRVKNLYISSGHRLQIVINKEPLKDARFLIQYHAVGCPDLVTPQHAWTERKQDELIVGCKATRQTWHLKCQSNRWVGVIGNCTQYLPNMPESSEVKGRNYLSYSGMAILVIIGVAGGISFVIITIGIICYTRLSRHNKKMEAQYQCSTYKSKELYNVRDGMEEYKDFGYPEQLYPFSKNEYTHIWDQQGSQCVDDLQQPMPVNDAPLLPKPRTNVRNNNNIIDISTDVAVSNISTSVTDVPCSQSEEASMYRTSVSESNSSASTGLSKYYVLDKSNS